MINPKIGRQLPEEQTRSRAGWLSKFQKAYSPTCCSGSSGFAVTVEGGQDRGDGRPLGYRALPQKSRRRAGAVFLVAGTLALAWWYVVIHQQVAAEPRRSQRCHGLVTAASRSLAGNERRNTSAKASVPQPRKSTSATPRFLSSAR